MYVQTNIFPLFDLLYAEPEAVGSLIDIISLSLWAISVISTISGGSAKQGLSWDETCNYYVATSLDLSL